MSAFTLATLGAWALVVVVAGTVRGRFYAIFVGVLMGLYSLVAAALAPSSSSPVAYGYWYLHGVVYLNFILLAWPRMRPTLFRVLVSWPAAWFLGGTLLAFPWAIAVGFGFAPRFLFVPYVVAFLGFLDSFLARRPVVHVVLGVARGDALARAPRDKGADPRPLRIVQITDPHLGPFMSVARLRRIVERAVAAAPDLVFLTGDFLTMESHSDHSLLGTALAPLKALEGRTFACFGNHDHEEPEHVRSGLREGAVTLLMDEMATVDTPVGPVEILGFDFRRREREAHLKGVTDRYPRKPGVTRIGLLHDPGAFRHLPVGAADLVLSGHTHGGQLGLLWLGLANTFVSTFTQIPDHGLWSRGTERLYVHRGTGHYGFPLRIGVPPEESVLEVHKR
jgi:predicted MPP superfamily phosphohydrolase